MKCSNCGFENKNKSKFCTKCGSSLTAEVKPPVVENSNNSKYIIIALVAIIIILVGTIGYFALSGSVDNSQSGDDSQQSNASQVSQAVESDDDESGEESNVQTQSVSSTKTVESKSWVSIGSYSGSGSGSETINVPEGKIMVKLSAYPIKNYASNHLYVSGSNGESGGVDWGSKSAVETRSDSFTYESSSQETFTIDYYETVSWEVEFFRYQ